MKSFTGKIGFALDILKARFTGQYKPFQVQFSVTNNCNLRCIYCYADYPRRTHKELGLKEVRQIIDELKRLKTRRINLVGGEPLLRKDIGEIIDYIKRSGIECAMTTNGYMVPKRLDEIRGLDLLCVSLDGDRDANDANRGAGSYDKAMAAISLAADNNIPLQVASVLTRHNLNSIEHLLKTGKEYGFAVGFSTLINRTVNGRKDASPDMPSDDEYREAIKKIIILKEKGYPVLFSKKSLRYALKWRYGYETDKVMGCMPDFRHIECNAGRFFCIIDVNGDVYPCPSLVDVIKPMNCIEHGTEAAFRHINNHTCRTCHIPCQNEFNLMYSFDAGVIVNILRNYRKTYE